MTNNTVFVSFCIQTQTTAIAMNALRNNKSNVQIQHAVLQTMQKQYAGAAN